MRGDHLGSVKTLNYDSTVVAKRSVVLWFRKTYKPDKCRGTTKIRELLI